MPAPGILKSAVRGLLHQAGGLSLLRHQRRQQFRILMYHNFPQSQADLPAVLERQCAHLRKHYQPVSLRTVGEFLWEGRPLPDHAVAVTVDDGYRDYLNAHAVFRRHGIPVTIFAVSGFLDRRLWLWMDQIQYVFQHTPKTQIDLPFAPQRLQWRDEEERKQAAGRLKSALKKVPDQQRRAFLNELGERLAVTLPVEPPPSREPLTWDEARRLSKEDVEFGPHTDTHPILSRMETAEALHGEIVASKRRLEEELQQPARHFCYPNGTVADFDQRTLGFVRDLKFETAVTATMGMNAGRPDPYLLRRIGVDLHGTDARFAEQLVGMHAEA